MTVEIDELNTQVRVTPPATASGTHSSRAATPGSAQNQQDLYEALRPIIRRILMEELEGIMRARGIR